MESLMKSTFVWGLVLIIAVTLYITSFSNSIFGSAAEHYKEIDRMRQEVLENGIEVEALIVDKDKLTDKELGTNITPVYINGTLIPIYSNHTNSSTNYVLKLYAEDQIHEVVVPHELYDSSRIGSKLPVKVYDNRIELLQ